MIKYRINVLDSLKKAGFNTYILRKNNIISQKSIQTLRNGQMIGIHTLNTICDLLQCQPGDLIYWEKDSQSSKKSE